MSNPTETARKVAEALFREGILSIEYALNNNIEKVAAIIDSVLHAAPAATTITASRQQINRVLNAMALELPAEIISDARQRIMTAFDNVAGTETAPEANPVPVAAWSRDEITLEQADSLYRFLQGKTIDGITCSAMPNLSSQQAFSVIYVLQEHLHLIPDHYEMCDKCGDLLDDHREGRYDEKTGQHYCEGCL